MAVHKWYYKTFIVESSVIYFSLRTTTPILSTFTKYPILYIVIIIFSIIFYLNEKFNRSVFYSLYLEREKNRQYKDLLENAVPSSIFVAKLQESQTEHSLRQNIF